MLIISAAAIEALKMEYGETDMVSCYAKAQGMNVPTQEAVLLLNNQKVIILFISKLTNKLIQKMMFNRVELSNSTLKSGLFLDERWTFTGRGQKWSFRIPAKILPLGNGQRVFLDSLVDKDFAS
ncbi:hypothetical protein I6N96_10805 [Enterococcus sp. BWM-S5]|uniref:Uncharacterized protein n=1 Tax=Enterococcus larvae TaxID=2794352 RepID=A0ABS4CJF8_9ENTE|nr:hypothetical protein [Enterococcus larvae]MBP1046755.1 hypothetical protein [Enterococcus larvae]